jgi:hypothetical protein
LRGGEQRNKNGVFVCGQAFIKRKVGGYIIFRLESIEM